MEKLLKVIQLDPNLIEELNIKIGRSPVLCLLKTRINVSDSDSKDEFILKILNEEPIEAKDRKILKNFYRNVLSTFEATEFQYA